MTASKHVYTAHLIGSPDIALTVRGGSVTLDADSYPHVRADIDIATPGTWSTVGGKPVWTPSPATLAALDPRLTKRVRIKADATFPTGTQTRTFNLGLRDRAVNHREGTISLSLASDEALAEDYSPIAEDLTPYDHRASLRAVTNYALGKIGASLQASPASNADVTPLWSITNLIPNPRPTTTALPEWAIGFNGTLIGSTTMTSPVPPHGPYAVQWNAPAAGISTLVAGTPASYRVSPGKWYVWTFYLASGASTSARAALQWRDRNGAGTLNTVYGAVVTSVNTEFRRLHVIAQAPVGAESVWPFVDTSGNTAGRTHFAASTMLYEGRRLVPYFDGGTAETADYLHTWADWEKPHASSSIRTPRRDAPTEDALTWKAGQGTLDFLAPLMMTAGYRLVCDESRAWTLRDASFTAPGSLSIRHAVNLIDGTDSISREADYWYDAALVTYTWTGPDGLQYEQTDSFVLTTPYTRLVEFKFTRPYPGPGMAQYLVQRAQGRGRELDLTTVSDWAARAEQAVTAILDGAPTQIGKTSRVGFNLDRDEMTVITRTTDTPAGAIDLKAGTINAMSGSINAQ